VPQPANRKLCPARSAVTKLCPARSAVTKLCPARSAVTLLRQTESRGACADPSGLTMDSLAGILVA
jgi:hypothetical protein